MRYALVAGIVFATVCSVFAEKRQLAPDMLRFDGSGTLVFVNAAGIPDKDLQAVADMIGSFLSVETEVRKGKWDMANAKKGLADMKANAAVYLAKDDALPLSLIAMEEKWGVANVKGLSDKAACKMALRVAIVLLGGASSKYPASVMRPARTTADVEKLGDTMTVDSLMTILPNLKDHGFVPFRIVDYATALVEGCAPPPANDEQRAIKAQWEKELAEEAAAAAKKSAAKKK